MSKLKKNSPSSVTSSDVAKLAGVSQSAVSRCFTPGASISEKMRKKIMTASKQLGFQPNALARSLITKQSKIIGVVFSYLSNQYYPTVLELLSKQLQEQGYHVMLFLIDQDEEVDPIVESVFQYQIDGLIMSSITLSSKIVNRCSALDIPIILFNRTSDFSHCSSVTSDNIEGGRKIAHFLVAAKHKKIAYIAGLEDSSTNRDRETGLKIGLSENNMELFAKAVGNYSFKQAQSACLELFKKDKNDWPDAIFVANDHMAIAVMDTLRYQLKLSIPDDVSIIGYDDVPQASWSSYQLTTLRQSANNMVKATVSCLIDHINDDEIINRKISIDGHLIVRQSSKIPDSGISNVNERVTWVSPTFK